MGATKPARLAYMELVAHVGLAVGGRQPGDSASGGEIAAEEAGRPESLRGTVVGVTVSERDSLRQARGRLSLSCPERSTEILPLRSAQSQNDKRRACSERSEGARNETARKGFQHAVTPSRPVAIDQPLDASHG